MFIRSFSNKRNLERCTYCNHPLTDHSEESIPWIENCICLNCGLHCCCWCLEHHLCEIQVGDEIIEYVKH
jgi:hypothetical protein